MSETLREYTAVERVATAIQALTYGEMLDVGAAVRDILTDRMGDDPEMFKDAMSVADLIHSWSVSELEPSP
jgi:hypothetical protein